MPHSPTPSCRRRAGFTLAEILLAMLVFAIAITTILALLARSIETVDEIILKDEAMRLSGAVEDFMQKQSFNDAYNMIYANQSGDNQMLVAFHYRANPGDLSPRASRLGSPGTDYVVMPLVKKTTDVSSSETDAREGRLFKVRLKLSAATNPATATAGVNMTTFPTNPDSYSSAVVVVYAEYFAVGNKDSALTNLAPVYAYNFAVRR